MNWCIFQIPRYALPPYTPGGGSMVEIWLENFSIPPFVKFLFIKEKEYLDFTLQFVKINFIQFFK